MEGNLFSSKSVDLCVNLIYPFSPPRGGVGRVCLSPQALMSVLYTLGTEDRGLLLEKSKGCKVGSDDQLL